MKIVSLSADSATRLLPGLAALLLDAVRHGASIGFLDTLSEADAAGYWRKIIAELPQGFRVLLGAFDESGRLIGSAQLALEPRANGRHRAEVQKVMVASSGRRRGVGAALMAEIEREAVARRRRLLFLDTSTGTGGATAFYEALGYSFVGSIPDYAADPDGRLVPNAIFYKLLAIAPEPLAASAAGAAPAVV